MAIFCLSFKRRDVITFCGLRLLSKNPNRQTKSNMIQFSTALLPYSE
ncbi:hypothetical protein P1059_00639 [Pasteurella multocida subsp. gallicida P1059]|nr:hypothetical protein P1059_00639 [Pasteurella multocida subsp. gallicida P1059]